MQLNFLGQRAAHDADHERRGSQRLDAFLFAGVSVVALANKGIRRWESVANTTNLKGIRQNESELSTLLYKAALLTFCDLVLGKGPELRDLRALALPVHDRLCHTREAWFYFARWRAPIPAASIAVVALLGPSYVAVAASVTL